MFNFKYQLRDNQWVMPLFYGVKAKIEYDSHGRFMRATAFFSGKNADEDSEIDFTASAAKITNIPASIKNDAGNIVVVGRIYLLKPKYIGKGTLSEVINAQIRGVIKADINNVLAFQPINFEKFSFPVPNYSSVRTAFLLLGFRETPTIPTHSSLQWRNVYDSVVSSVEDILNVEGVIVIDNTTKSSLELCNEYGIDSVKDIKITYDENGFLEVTLVLQNGKYTAMLEEIKRHRLGKGTRIVFNKEPFTIRKSEDLNGTPFDRELLCPECGGRIDLAGTKKYTCCNSTCPSKLQRKLTNYLNLLEIPIDLEAIKELLKKKRILSAVDFFRLDLEESTRKTKKSPIYLPLIKALSKEHTVTLIGLTAAFFNGVLDLMTVKELVNAAKDDAVVFRTFIEKPLTVKSLNVSEKAKVSFIRWASDMSATKELLSLLDCPRFNFKFPDGKTKKPPLLAGFTIAFTGDFRKMPLPALKELLASYSAEIHETIQPSTKYLVIGDNLQGIDGMLVQDARKQKCFEIRESEFLKRYNIGV